MNLRSVAEVFAALAPNGEDAKSKMGLASLLKLIWALTRRMIAKAGSSMTGCTPTSKRTAHSRWSRRCAAG